jgi:hypothetical protein
MELEFLDYEGPRFVAYCPQCRRANCRHITQLIARDRETAWSKAGVLDRATGAVYDSVEISLEDGTISFGNSA